MKTLKELKKEILDLRIVVENYAEREVPELKKKIQDLEKKIQELTVLLAEKEALLFRAKKDAEKYSQWGAMIHERWRAASDVIKAMEKQWFHRPSIKKALQEYKDVES